MTAATIDSADLEMRFHHFPRAGVSLGVIPRGEDYVQVVAAWTHPSDQFARREGRVTCIERAAEYLQPGFCAGPAAWLATLETHEFLQIVAGARALEWASQEDEDCCNDFLVRMWLAEKLFEALPPGVD